MPDIWMDVNTAVTIPVNKVPLVASADGHTIDEGIAYNESGMDLNWNFVTTQGAQTQTHVTPTTGDDHDWTHVGNGMYKIEMPTSGGDANNNTIGFGWFSGKADGICPFSGPVIGFRHGNVNNVLIDNDWDIKRGFCGTALPNASSDAPGGLPISAAGALNLDAKLANVALTAQQARDAMKLAPSGNSPAAGSVDKHLDDIVEDTNELQANQGNWLTAAGFSTHSAANVWGVGTRTLTSFGTLIIDIWHHLLTGITTASTIGKLIKDYLNAAISTRSSHNAAAVKTAMETDGSKLDHLWETTEDDAGVRRFSENALEQAPSGAGLTDTQNKALILIRDIMEGDAVIDINTTPWQLIIKKKDTDTEVVKKNLKDINGVNLISVASVIGQQLEP